jgi:hypothetical protein
MTTECYPSLSCLRAGLTLRTAAAALAAGLGATLSSPLAAQEVAAPARPVLAAGYVPLAFEPAKGKVLLQVPAFDEDVLYYVSAATGGGSVELPFDRGIMETAVIRFQRVGQRVLVVQANTDYRAPTGNAATMQGVADSFPTSVLASLPIESLAGGKVTVDATPLFMRDAADVEGALRNAKQGNYKFDGQRSAFYPQRIKVFPENSEVETIATFVSDNPGQLVRGVTPDGRSLTLRIHHSFLRPPSGYTPRRADPRIGVSDLKFKDYSASLADRPETALITRWRLEKKNPAAAMSEPVKPITFYFDPAIPEPIRTAMKQGTLWWNKAFEQAGFVNAVQALDAPADMDPMDIRFAYVLWINRDERGFSSGGTYRDPRTGEIIGSKTRMDTHRIRTVGNYWDAYSGALAADGSGVTVADPVLLTPGALAEMPAGQRDMILLRQALLTAHELGHALGFGHNFAASLNDRASVMEYPTPRVKVVGGKLDLSDAYMKQIGAYDTAMVRYAYTPLAAAQEKAKLDGVIADMRAAGLIYVPSTDPRWTWYDDRATASENLRETAAARRIMLANYGAGALGAGEPVGALRDARLWMVYLHNRYAIESGLKYVGGVLTNIVIRGDTLPPTQMIPAAEQREVLGLLLDAASPENLALPAPLLAQLTPDPDGNLEDLSDDPAFDQLKAARIMAALVYEPLFDPVRANRMLALEARQPDTLTFDDMVSAVIARTFPAAGGSDASERALQRVAQGVAIDSMMVLGASEAASLEARALILDRLERLGSALAKRNGGDAVGAAFNRQSARRIAAYIDDPAANAPKTVSPAWGKGPRSRFPQPPGPPLG